MAKRLVLRIDPEKGVQLGSRAGNRGPWQPLAEAIPLPASVSDSHYHEIRVERLDRYWWVFFDGHVAATVPTADQPELSEFRLVVDGRQARFSDLEASQLNPSSH